MARSILPEDRIHPAIREKVANRNSDLIAEVEAAIAAHDVVVLGMTVNPHVKKARKALAVKGIEHHYLGYGGYLGQWRRRNALKMWTGWGTMPLVFVKGIFVGGGSDLIKLIESGELEERLSSAPG